jgi:ribosomal protein S18 acetylase RimI-like enzyme
MPLTQYPKQMNLRNGQSVAIRPLEKGDFEPLSAFFLALPAEDKIYLRHDVADPAIIRQWTERIDLEHVIPLVAVADDAIVADGTLHVSTHGWMQHVGHIRLVIARSHQRLGLGTLLARELVNLAEHRGLEKLQAHVIEGNAGAVRMFERVGFEKAAVLKDLVKDQNGRHQNLAVMINDVSRLSQVLEDWVQDMMIPGFRGSGEAFG